MPAVVGTYSGRPSMLALPRLRAGYTSQCGNRTAGSASSCTSRATAPALSATCRRRVSCRATSTPPATPPVKVEDEYMKEYRELKEGLLDRTRKAAALVALYLLVTVDGKASLCALVGSGFSLAYLMWLFYDIDSVAPTDRIALLEAEKFSPSLRAPAKLLAAWTQALRPRLLVPIAMAASIGAYGAIVGEPLNLTYDGCLLLGFLSYKAALLTLLAKDDKAKAAEAVQASRPSIERIPDELDKWGRPKFRTPLPTAALPEGVDVSGIRVPPSLLGLDDADMAAAEAAAADELQREMMKLRRQQKLAKEQQDWLDGGRDNRQP